MKKILSVLLILCIIVPLGIVSASAAVDTETRNYYYINTDIDKGTIYTYESFVKANNLLPDAADYTPAFDEITLPLYNEHVEKELRKVYDRNLEFYKKNFTDPKDELICCSEVHDRIMVYTTEERVALLKLYYDVSYYKAASTKESADSFLVNNKSQYYYTYEYTPQPYELVYAMHFYKKDNELRDVRGDKYDYMYYPLYYHYADKAEAENTEATPDYVLMFGGANMMSPAYSAGEFGDYLLQEYNIYYPYIYGHYIITLADGKVHTLTEAYNDKLAGVMDVFEDYGLGYLRGDANFDKKLNIRDATYIQKCLAELEEFNYNDYVSGFAEGDADFFSAYVSDFNRDGKRNVRDVTDIQKHLAGVALDDPAYKDYEGAPIPDPPVKYTYVKCGTQTLELLPGDKIRLTAELKSNIPVTSADIDIKYNPYKISVAPVGDTPKADFIKEHCPNVPHGVLLNYYGYNNETSEGGNLNFLFTDYSGLDFSENKMLFYFDFVVTNHGECEIKISNPTLTGMDLDTIFSNGGVNEEGAEIEFSYKIEKI